MHDFFPNFDYASRINKLQKKLSHARADCMLLGAGNHPDPNAHYLCGDTAFPTFLAITPRECTVYSTQPPEQFSSFATALPLQKFKQDAKKILGGKKFKKIAFDPQSQSGAKIAFKLQKNKKQAIPFTKQLQELRMIKDAEEIKCIERAQKITKECLFELHRMHACGKLFGETENYLAGAMELRARELGASLDAFPPLVQSGAHASVFHEATSNAIAREGEVLLADVGAKYLGYCGDATHTFYDGKDRQTRDAIEAVNEAKKAAEKKARIGIKGKTLSDAALKVLREYGFKKDTFKDAGLALGHFVGIEVHDGPSLEQQTLKRGMCFTIEPGIYVPKKFGARFEDVTILK